MVPGMSRMIGISATDGRHLEVELSGPEDGRPLIFHAGTPSAGRVYPPMAEAGATRGIRHIAYSRPGYGASDRHAGRTVADCAADVAAIADELGIERFLTLGWSGGGPHALACAALLGERVIAAVSLAGVGPFGAEGLDFLAGMGQENIDEFGAAVAGQAQLRAYLEREAPLLAGAQPADLLAGLGDLISEVDRGALTGDFAVYLAGAAAAALENGIWGWFDDDLAFCQDWGFDLGRIERPVAIWQGGQDRFVPFAHGQWLAGRIPGAEAQLHPEQGHLSLGVDSYVAILDGLLARD
jgi:pimeloyl-ACP methyl ester carboxylesterase